jgi:diketogulonate reductase-like aldo/keto reductase
MSERMEKFTTFILSEEVMQEIAKHYHINPDQIVVSCIYSKENMSIWKIWNHARIRTLTGLDKIQTIWKFGLPWICRIEV